MRTNYRASKSLFVLKALFLAIVFNAFIACQNDNGPSAADILGSPDYPAIAYGGYRYPDRSKGPSVEDIKEDLKILDAMGIKILRTYHARLYDHTPNLLQAIREMKEEDPSFEMYVMLGAWMQCENAWTDNPNHNLPDAAENEAEIKQAIKLSQEYPDIVKVIAVGNESMVHWASGYYVHPRIILKEVIRLQLLKKEGKLPADLWITSSDNFASWGGAEESYHLPALDSLMAAVDYLSVHSYPFHDTHYHPDWWWVPAGDDSLEDFIQIKQAVARGLERVEAQIEAVKAFMESSLGYTKPIHIGETGWASLDNNLYGAEGSRAADEYKQMLYYRWIKQYCNRESMACFYFEAFDEPWKDGKNPDGSENHFGLFTVDGQVKAPLWDLYDQGTFEGLKRFGKSIRKTLNGDKDALLKQSKLPPLQSDLPHLRSFGGLTMDTLMGYIVWPGLDRDVDERFSPIVAPIKLVDWEGSCQFEMDAEGKLRIQTGTGTWWGGALDVSEDIDLSDFWTSGGLMIRMKGNTRARFELGLQSGTFSAGDLQSAFVPIGAGSEYILKSDFQDYYIPYSSLGGEIDPSRIRSLLYLKGLDRFDGKHITIDRMVHYYDLPEPWVSQNETRLRKLEGRE